MKRPLGRGSGQGGENELLRVGWRSILIRDNAVRPFSWVESSCLWHDYFYKARKGQGRQGERACLGRGRKRALEGHQLEQTETEHSCRSGYMLSRCLPGTGPCDISAKGKASQLHGYVQCPCRAVSQWPFPRRALIIYRNVNDIYK